MSISIYVRTYSITLFSSWSGHSDHSSRFYGSYVILGLGKHNGWAWPFLICHLGTCSLSGPFLQLWVHKTLKLSPTKLVQIYMLLSLSEKWIVFGTGCKSVLYVSMSSTSALYLAHTCSFTDIINPGAKWWPGIESFTRIDFEALECLVTTICAKTDQNHDLKKNQWTIIS